jgi:UDP-N-acetylglucosamine 2-epimerase (non-hydrolysing)/UDP-GlcNAc3NAcA epimerase
VANLRAERAAGKVEIVGDVMVDVALTMQPRAREREVAAPDGAFLLATAHRAGNVDDPERLHRLVDLLTGMPFPVVLPLHPRTRARLEAAGLMQRVEAELDVRPPLGYLDFTALLLRTRAVLTDSGGVQKEAYLAGVPCITLRDTTEWVETLTTGWNVLVDLDAEAAKRALDTPPPDDRPELYGDGNAGERVVDALSRFLGG